MNRKEKLKLLARFLSEVAFRNSQLENLHTGITPSSKTGDFTDVKVVTPYGEIEWKELSRISDKEMRILMLDIEKRVADFLKNNFKTALPTFYEEKGWWDFLGSRYRNGVSWDSKFGDINAKPNEELKVG